jgi:hypothetical protein
VVASPRWNHFRKVDLEVLMRKVLREQRQVISHRSNRGYDPLCARSAPSALQPNNDIITDRAHLPLVVHQQLGSWVQISAMALIVVALHNPNEAGISLRLESLGAVWYRVMSVGFQCNPLSISAILRGATGNRDGGRKRLTFVFIHHGVTKNCNNEKQERCKEQSALKKRSALSRTRSLLRNRSTAAGSKDAKDSNTGKSNSTSNDVKERQNARCHELKLE